MSGTLRLVASDPLADFGRHIEAAIGALRDLTEQMADAGRAAMGEIGSLASHPTRVTGQVRRGAEEAVDLSTAWIDPVRRLSDEQRRFADQMATWAERHRQFAEEVASWAETQRAFAEHLSSWAEPLLTYSEQLAAAVKGLMRAVLPGDAAAGG
jgi:methyl-accepting chemotaxis protein